MLTRDARWCSPVAAPSRYRHVVSRSKRCLRRLSPGRTRWSASGRTDHSTMFGDRDRRHHVVRLAFTASTSWRRCEMLLATPSTPLYTAVPTGPSPRLTTAPYFRRRRRHHTTSRAVDDGCSPRRQHHRLMNVSELWGNVEGVGTTVDRSSLSARRRRSSPAASSPMFNGFDAIAVSSGAVLDWLPASLKPFRASTNQLGERPWTPATVPDTQTLANRVNRRTASLPAASPPGRQPDDRTINWTLCFLPEVISTSPAGITG